MFLKACSQKNKKNDVFDVYRMKINNVNALFDRFGQIVNEEDTFQGLPFKIL